MNKTITLAEFSPLIEEALENGNQVQFTVTGNSMAPLLRHGIDKVCIVKPGKKPLQKLDIPLYVRADGKYILHRIIAVKKDGYMTAGDNRPTIEYPVDHSRVIGVVKGIWRGGRYIGCDGFLYRLYSGLWVFLLPIRRIISGCKRPLAKAQKVFNRRKEKHRWLA